MNAGWSTISGSGYGWVYGFQGMRYDGVSGLNEADLRWYSSSQGVWTSLDPIGFMGGTVNLYLYIDNEPVDGVDPLGLLKQTLDLDIRLDNAWLNDNSAAFIKLLQEVTCPLPSAIEKVLLKKIHDSGVGGPNSESFIMKQAAEAKLLACREARIDACGAPYQAVLGAAGFQNPSCPTCKAIQDKIAGLSTGLGNQSYQNREQIQAQLLAYMKFIISTRNEAGLKCLKEAIANELRITSNPEIAARLREILNQFNNIISISIYI